MIALLRILPVRNVIQNVGSIANFLSDKKHQVYPRNDESG